MITDVSPTRARWRMHYRVAEYYLKMLELYCCLLDCCSLLLGWD